MWTTVILALLWLGSARVAGFEPDVAATVFESISPAVVYFDDSSHILAMNHRSLQISKDDGKTWDKVPETGDKLIKIWTDEVDRSRAFAATESNVHYYTTDKGETWTQLEFDVEASAEITTQTNYANPQYVLTTITDCGKSNHRSLSSLRQCQNKVFYTDDGFATAPKPLGVKDAHSCTFLKTNRYFTVGDDRRIHCLTKEYDSFHFVKDVAIYESADWFKTSTLVNDASGLLASSYVFEIRVVQSFVVVIVQTDRYDAQSSIQFYVSKDGSTFHKADFDVDMSRAAYVILPSTPSSLHIATLSYKNSMDFFASADFYRSDSSGLFYTKTKSSLLGGLLGNVAIDKVDNIDGSWLVNEIAGTDEYHIPFYKSRVSTDDGVTWDVLKLLDDPDCSNDEKCSLNLVSSKETDGENKAVTGPTPGILMGIGSVGQKGTISKTLDELSQLATYMSKDGGLHWRKVLDVPSAFVFGDQGNVIVTVPAVSVANSDSNASSLYVDTLHYSLDQGESWQEYKLDRSVFPRIITTTIDGSSSKFILVGLFSDPGHVMSTREVIYSIDFSKAFDGKVCAEEDFVDWYARPVDDAGTDGKCLFGHKEKFLRRKADAKCLINKVFEDLKVVEESCPCSEEDFECALGFVKDEAGICQPDVRVIAANFCQQTGKKISIPVKQKVPDSICKGGAKLDTTKQEFDCKQLAADDQTFGIVTKSQSFTGSIAQYYYLQASSDNKTVADETVILRTSEREIYYSFNGGENFFKMTDLDSRDDQFVAVYLNPYFADYVYLVTSNSKIYVSRDRGINFVVHKAPSDINEFGLKLLSFNRLDPGRFIWYGEKNCHNFFSSDCRSIAYHTTDGGASFEPLLEDIRNCYYVGSTFDDTKYNVDHDQVYCEQKVAGTNYLALVSSSDHFKTTQVLFDKIVGIAVTGDFVVVASLNTDQRSLEAHVTVDGSEFADAAFPADFHVDRQQAYTTIDSSTKALFLHVTQNSAKDAEFGTILKSNSNGTSYVKSIDNVNRNSYGYVDYEKVEGLEGVSLINVVDNAGAVSAGKGYKKLKTMITHNDGSEWNYMAPPAVDSEGNRYACQGKSLEKCSLNLHGFTERVDLRDTYSSGSAIGMLVGVGNVGEHLVEFNDDATATFMTKDGGITWKEIKKGNYMWEYGDQGTILVLAPNDGNPADTVSFSLDEGDSWSDYKFVDEPVTILDLATVPSDTARRFLLFARSKSNVLLAFTIDFSHVHARQCKLDFDDPSKDDFEYWSPKHPFVAENCLFGHEAIYLRRVSSHSDCFIGAAPLNNAYKVLRNCACNRKDYECDYNYARAKDGTCKLVDGLSPADHSAVCAKDDSLLEYWEPTGYRKIPLSTCEGGKELDKWVSHPCPGKESQFNDRYTVRGFALFLTIFVPITVFVAATWFVYDRGIRRNGGFARFGQIRLDEDDFHPIENNRTDKVVNDVVKALILAIGAVITLRSLAKNKILGLFSRSSRYDRVFGQDHDVILDDDSLFNFNDIDNDDDAREIDSFIQQNDDDFSTTAAGHEYSDDPTSKDSDQDIQIDHEEDDVTEQ